MFVESSLAVNEILTDLIWHKSRLAGLTTLRNTLPSIMFCFSPELEWLQKALGCFVLKQLRNCWRPTEFCVSLGGLWTLPGKIRRVQHVFVCNQHLLVFFLREKKWFVSLWRFCCRLNADVTRFGRHSHNDYYLDSSQLAHFISRWHSEIHRVEQEGKTKYIIRDNSLNGTYVNDVRVSTSDTHIGTGQLCKIREHFKAVAALQWSQGKCTKPNRVGTCFLLPPGKGGKTRVMCAFIPSSPTSIWCGKQLQCWGLSSCLLSHVRRRALYQRPRLLHVINTSVISVSCDQHMRGIWSFGEGSLLLSTITPDSLPQRWQSNSYRPLKRCGPEMQ